MRRRLIGRLVRRLARKQHPRHSGQAEILERDGRLQPYATEVAAVCNRGCNRVRRRLQPYVTEAAALCVEAATLALRASELRGNDRLQT